jgi:DNA processing protein
VFVVPGRVGDKYSEGCNYFIKTNKANLVECANDIAYLMGWQDQKKMTVPKQKEIFVELNEREKLVVELLKTNGPCMLTKSASKRIFMEVSWRQRY